MRLIHQAKVSTMGLFRGFTRLITGGPSPKFNRPLRQLTERDVIETEARYGEDIFGPVPAGGRREFFCLDSKTWIWHEEWLDENKNQQSRTTRYEIHNNGIMKIQDGLRYQFLDGEELRNFTVAVRIYYERVMRNVFGRDPDTGRPLAGATGTMGVDVR